IGQSFCFTPIWVSCALKKDVIQPDPLIVTQLGQSVTLNCFCRSHLISVSWYKQTVGQKPLLMASSNYGTENSFYLRLNVKRGFDSCNLTISKTESWDSATYYCVSLSAREARFGEGTVLIVKGDLRSNCMSVLQKPVSVSVQPGDSVTLNCTIHTETCAGKHSVYWYRHGSGKSHPGVIYTHGDRNDQCEKSPETGSPTQSCVYKLPKRNLSLSDAGTYYCAVASCGEILFGNGTKLDIEGKLCITKIQHYFSVKCDDDALNYAALKFTEKKSTKPRRQRREQREEETIYSGVSNQDRM
uniref:Ig-like domain-containing protein n=1 Tax=Salmo trutta TaxID=8032 RepID=A0A674ECG2_SALTR